MRYVNQKCLLFIFLHVSIASEDGIVCLSARFYWSDLGAKHRRRINQIKSERLFGVALSCQTPGRVRSGRGHLSTGTKPAVIGGNVHETS